ncbi:SRPBCC family protein [Bdellovibrio sp. HCB209]|uniref:SRPBCC family protein n=1 Tax=Bdellovibrio sp. HCB209 TaxID=3394354 RepID=UPI0039B56772
MVKKIALGVLILVVVFLGYVATRPSAFRYENSTVINAPADKIFPYLSNFKLGGQWNPFEQADPNMKKTFTGEDGKVGSVFEFEGNSDAGSGKLEMLQVIPNEFAQMKLTMTKPIAGEQMIDYRLTPEGQGTRFTWTMHGDGGFISKLMTVLIDCQKMFSNMMGKGFDSLKKVVETPEGSAPVPTQSPAN